QSSGWRGIDLWGTSLEERVDVTEAAPVPSTDGLRLQDNATFRTGSVNVSGSATAGLIVEQTGSPGPVVEDLQSTGPAGAAITRNATLKRVRLSGSTNPLVIQCFGAG